MYEIVGVHVAKTAPDAVEDLHHRLGVEWALPVEDLTQVLAFDELRHHPRSVRRVDQVIDGDEVRMRDETHHPRLSPEPLARLRVALVLRAKGLHGDTTAGLQVNPVIHDRHPAGADGIVEFDLVTIGDGKSRPRHGVAVRCGHLVPRREPYPPARRPPAPDVSGS